MDLNRIQAATCLFIVILTLDILIRKAVDQNDRS